MAKEQEQMTMEEYLLSQMDTPVVLKDGTMMTKPDGSPMTKQEAIATNILNLTWDETELQAVQADVEGFEVADFGFDIADLPQVVMPTDKNAGEDVNPDDYGEDFTLPDGERSPFQQMTFIVTAEQVELIKNAMSKAKAAEDFGEFCGNNNVNGNALYYIVKQWAEQKK